MQAGYRMELITIYEGSWGMVGIRDFDSLVIPQRIRKKKLRTQELNTALSYLQPTH
jgi:hypothetical protein